MIDKTWSSFQGSKWKTEINVRDFIQHNYTQYNGDEKFLSDPTDATNELWNKLQDLQ
jgi:formate C-acetyltransferase